MEPSIINNMTTTTTIIFTNKLLSDIMSLQHSNDGNEQYTPAISSEMKRISDAKASTILNQRTLLIHLSNNVT